MDVGIIVAHPRGCGEHQFLLGFIESSLGSSPRVRGTFLGNESHTPLLGLIPAGAGNIRERWFEAESIGAHPRGCGEHVLRCTPLRLNSGSSPRVRGTLQRGIQENLPIGLIPAGAGNMV